MTDGVESFYMDLDGEYDPTMAKLFTWSAPPISVTIVRPHLVGLLQNQMIEVRHLMEPRYVSQVIFLNDLQISMPFAVSTQTNLTMQILDSMYIIVMESQHQRKQVMVKLS